MEKWQYQEQGVVLLLRIHARGVTHWKEMHTDFVLLMVCGLEVHLLVKQKVKIFVYTCYVLDIGHHYSQGKYIVVI